MDRYNLISFAGIFFLLGFAWLFSADKRNMKRWVQNRIFSKQAQLLGEKIDKLFSGD